MHRLQLCIAFALALLCGTANVSQAEALLTSGIGLSSCAKIGPALKPGAGLDHLPNALLFYWVQGYLSAANIYLLNEYTDYAVLLELLTDHGVGTLMHR